MHLAVVAFLGRGASALDGMAWGGVSVSWPLHGVLRSSGAVVAALLLVL